MRIPNLKHSSDNSDMSNPLVIPMSPLMSDHPFASAPRLALLTGGSSGLGRACAGALLDATAPPWRVLIASRDALQGERVAAELNLCAGREAVRFLPLDLGDLHSVRALGQHLRERGERLDALVCNAGLQFAREARTAQGLEATFGVNHLGHFALFHELAPLLSEQARVVVVSSGTHDPAQHTGIPAPRMVDPAHLAWPERDPHRRFEQADGLRTTMQRRYSTSKLCNLLFAYELARRIERGEAGVPTTVTVNAFDPGLMPGTGLARDYPAALRWVWRQVMPRAKPLLARFMGGNVHSPDWSGRALAEWVAGPEWAGRSGLYAEGRRPIASSPESRDEARARDLWAASLAMLEELAVPAFAQGQAPQRLTGAGVP
jgi:NAD(P)-dependent dehydrogenase (short-subunit alcohol dehydrogenase family)